MLQSLQGREDSASLSWRVGGGQDAHNYKLLRRMAIDYVGLPNRQGTRLQCADLHINCDTLSVQIECDAWPHTLMLEAHKGALEKVAATRLEICRL